MCLQAIFIMTKTTCTILKRPEFDIFSTFTSDTSGKILDYYKYKMLITLCLWKLSHRHNAR